MFSVTGNQIVAHLVGDYILQSDWMASEKTKRCVPALAHAIAYTIPFFFITQESWPLLAIGGSHFVIDRWRLARYVVWIKNFAFGWPPHDDWSYFAWRNCVATGYNRERPIWLAGWLLIIADNTIHLLCNAAALTWLV